jgi:hypothetical protein
VVESCIFNWGFNAPRCASLRKKFAQCLLTYPGQPDIENMDPDFYYWIPGIIGIKVTVNIIAINTQIS